MLGKYLECMGGLSLPITKERVVLWLTDLCCTRAFRPQLFYSSNDRHYRVRRVGVGGCTCRRARGNACSPSVIILKWALALIVRVGLVSVSQRLAATTIRNAMGDDLRPRRLHGDANRRGRTDLAILASLHTIYSWISQTPYLNHIVGQ